MIAMIHLLIHTDILYSNIYRWEYTYENTGKKRDQKKFEEHKEDKRKSVAITSAVCSFTLWCLHDSKSCLIVRAIYV